MKDGEEVIILLEFQTRFSKEFIWRLIDYTMRFRLRYRLKVIPVVLVFVPTQLATGFYENELITFRHEALRLWEEQAREYLDAEEIYPFLPLMEGGEEVLEEAERKIYNSDRLTIEEKGDILTAMAIFAGLKSKELAKTLIERRRDIMIQSAAYEIIKQEGLKEGLEQGLDEGLERGIKDSMYQVFDVRFNLVPVRLVRKINRVREPEMLKTLLRSALTVDSLEEFEAKMKLALE